MALPKLFQRIFWHNNTTPAINEDNLNAMSKAIDDLDNRVIVLGDDVITVIPQIQAYLEQAEDLVEAMELLSENPPYIGQNGNWWVWDTNTSAFVDSGVDASISVDIADITMLAPNAEPYVTNSGTDTDPIFHLFIPRGQTGNGISTIAKTGTSGLVDTYTITMTDGTTSTFTVTNGAGDMNKSVYDPTNAIANAGGMKSAAAKDSTNAVTANSTDLVESGAVYTADKDIYEVMGQNGVKNLLNVTATTQTQAGITFTVNNNKSVAISGTSTSDGNYLILNNETHKVMLKANQSYILSASGNARVIFEIILNTSHTWYSDKDGNHVTASTNSKTFTNGNTDVEVFITVRVYTGAAINTTVYPMLRLASDTDPTYQPYAETNQQLTSKTDGLWDNMMENGAVNLLQITVPSQVINGVTYTVNADKTISAHTSGQTITQNAQLVQNVTLPSGTYKQTGCPSGGSDSTYRIGGFDGNDYGNGRLISSAGTTRQLYFTVFAGQNIPANNPIVFKPMISDPSLDLSYDDYVPYAMTNRELTEELSVQSTSVSAKGITATLVRYGKVCEVKWGGSFSEAVNHDTTFLTLPAGYRPVIQTEILSTNELASLSKSVRIACLIDGGVQVFANVASGDALRGCMTYIIGS